MYLSHARWDCIAHRRWLCDARLQPVKTVVPVQIECGLTHHTATPTLFFTLTHTCKARTCQTTVWSKIKELDWNEMKWNKGTRPMLFRFSSFHFVRFVRALSECWTNFKMHYRLWFNTLFPRWPTVGRVASTVVGLVTFDCTRGLSTGYFTIQTVLST